MFQKPICKPDCPGRKPGCHGTCEAYKAWKEEFYKEKYKLNKAKKQQKAIDQVLYDNEYHKAVRRWNRDTTRGI